MSDNPWYYPKEGPDDLGRDWNFLCDTEGDWYEVAVKLWETIQSQQDEIDYLNEENAKQKEEIKEIEQKYTECFDSLLDVAEKYKVKMEETQSLKEQLEQYEEVVGDISFLLYDLQEFNFEDLNKKGYSDIVLRLAEALNKLGKE